MYQSIQIIGNLGRKPEMRYTQTGQAVTNLSVAANRAWRNDQGDKVQETIWFRVSVWGTNAENAVKYLDKGSKVFIVGRLIPDTNGNPRTWTDNEGLVRANFEVNALRVVYLSSRNDQPSQDDLDGFDDIPFDLSDEDQDIWKDGASV